MNTQRENQISSDWIPILIDDHGHHLLKLVTWGSEPAKQDDKYRTLFSQRNSLGYRILFTDMIHVFEAECSNVDMLITQKKTFMPQLKISKMELSRQNSNEDLDGSDGEKENSNESNEQTKKSKIIRSQSHSTNVTSKHIKKASPVKVRQPLSKSVVIPKDEPVDQDSLRYVLKLLEKIVVKPTHPVKYFFGQPRASDEATDRVILSVKTKIDFFPFEWSFECRPLSEHQSSIFIRDTFVFPFFTVSKELARQNQILKSLVVERDMQIAELKKNNLKLSRGTNNIFDPEAFTQRMLASQEFDDFLKESKMTHGGNLDETCGKLYSYCTNRPAIKSVVKQEVKTEQSLRFESTLSFPPSQSYDTSASQVNSTFNSTFNSTLNQSQYDPFDLAYDADESEIKASSTTSSPTKQMRSVSVDESFEESEEEHRKRDEIRSKLKRKREKEKQKTVSKKIRFV